MFYDASKAMINTAKARGNKDNQLKTRDIDNFALNKKSQDRRQITDKKEKQFMQDKSSNELLKYMYQKIAKPALKLGNTSADFFDSIKTLRPGGSSKGKDVLKVKITEIENDILKATVLEQLKDVFRYMESDDLTFVKDEILKFCKNQEIKQAIMDSVSLLKHGNFDEIKTKIDSAMKAGADTNIGLEYVTDVAARYNEAARHTITTGWDVVDDLMDGGLAPGELGVVMAPAGIGKSWLLINIGAHAVKAGKTVIHYTLELNENYVGQRYDSVITGIPAQNLKNYRANYDNSQYYFTCC
jgi:hypothetical protein